ncbi:kinase-like domain-containing protein [Absidia repens]|uniref:Kinase-like domain-containing protein n=1 Tax=Absidia repens TaxID=90262 RepID=A0A1X2I0P2_9FUNG|nr:kinase-like domain-containing protein [Absidia repens]
MQQVNGVQVYKSDPALLYEGLEKEPTWFSAQGGVYQCYDRTTQRPIAIKKYLVEDTQQSDAFVMPQELVENEIYTMTKCNHDNILKLLSVHLHQESVYLIMPLCAGGSLQQYVFEHHLNFGQLAHIISSIAAGLEEIHRHGYIHRDIKCDNIFLDDQANQVVIGDFGVVSITPAADSSVEEAGVVLFWAPELVQGKVVNRKVDIWALGIVILEIINGGRAPYEDEKLEEDEIKQRIIMNGKPAYPDGLPPRLIDLLDRCLHPDPRARASATEVLKHTFLLDYEHEPLFTTSADNQHSLVSIDPSAVDEDSMLSALKSLQEMTLTHEMDMTSDSTLPALSDTPDSLSSTQSQYLKSKSATPRSASRLQHIPRRCRLPLPSFVLDEEHIASIPAKDKIDGIRLKRQSLTEEHRNQGSRLPMLKMILATPPPPPEPDILISSGKKLKKARSVRLSSTSAATSTIPPTPSTRDHTKTDAVRKPLTRSRTLPIQQRHKSVPPSSGLPKNTKNTEKKSNQQNGNAGAPPLSRSPVSSRKKEPTAALNTPKDQPLAYRQKRLPDSRTARLMMGISTTGRRSTKGQSSSPTSPPASPVVAKSISTTAKRLSSSLTASLSGKKRQEIKQRPLSFSGPKATTSAMSLTAQSRQKSPPPPSLPPVPESRSHQRHGSVSQSRSPTQAATMALPPSSSVTPLKARRRLSTTASKSGQSPASSSSSNGSVGKNETLKGMKVLRAY